MSPTYRGIGNGSASASTPVGCAPRSTRRTSGGRVIPLTGGPRATLGPSIPVTLPRPRARTAINHNYDFKQTRFEVIDYLLKATDKRKVAMSRKITLPDLLPEDLNEPRRLLGAKRRPRRRSEEKRETVEVVGV